MISNQILQSTIDGLKNISRNELCVLDTEGNILAATTSGMEQYQNAVCAFITSPADSQVVQGYQFFKVFGDIELEYILLVSGSEENSYMIGKMAAYQLQCLLTAYKEKYDKDNFIKNLLLDNLLLVDIYNRSKKLHIDTTSPRIVFIVEVEHDRENSAIEILRAQFGTKNHDFITAIDEDSIILVKGISPEDGYQEMERIALMIQDSLKSIRKDEALIAYGTIVNEIKEVSRSYKEARMALDVGKIFFSERTIIAYSSLGIGRLIYQLPIPLCKMFIKEIFGGKMPDDFDEETLVTINKFFENSLNVSETSRQLYIHRNTLVYRLDKLQKSTGLDLRVFEDAITFKIALMVVKYMKYMENTDY